MKEKLSLLLGTFKDQKEVAPTLNSVDIDSLIGSLKERNIHEIDSSGVSIIDILSDLTLNSNLSLKHWISLGTFKLFTPDDFNTLPPVKREVFLANWISNKNNQNLNALALICKHHITYFRHNLKKDLVFIKKINQYLNQNSKNFIKIFKLVLPSLSSSSPIELMISFSIVTDLFYTKHFAKEIEKDLIFWIKKELKKYSLNSLKKIKKKEYSSYLYFYINPYSVLPLDHPTPHDLPTDELKINFMGLVDYEIQERS